MEQRFVASHGPIYLGAGSSFEPFVIEEADGRLSGHDVELVSLINRLTGLDLRIVTGVWNDITQRARDGTIDGLVASSQHSSRTRYFNASRPYLTFSHIVIVKAGNPHDLLQVSDLVDRRVALQRGNLLFEEAYRSLGVDSKPLYFDSYFQVLSAVAEGRADYCILDETAFFLAERIGISSLIDEAFSFGEPFDLVFWFRKDMPELVGIFNKALAAIPRQQKMDLWQRWFRRPGAESGRTLLADLSPGDRRYLERKGSLVACVTEDYMPLEGMGEDFEHRGIASDYLRSIAEQLGLRLTYRIREAGQDFAICDLITLLSPQSLEDSALRLTSPYLNLPLALATLRQTPFLLNLKQAGDKVFAVVAGSLEESLLRRDFPTLRMLTVADFQEALNAMEQGRVVGLLGIAPVLYKAISDRRLEGLQIQGSINHKVAVSMALPASQPLLYNLVQKALNAIDRTERKRIFDKWVAEAVQPVADYRFVGWLLAGFLLVLTLVLAWHYKLRQAHAQTELAVTRLRKIEDELRESNRQLVRLTYTDQLTQISNRKRLDEFLDSQLEQFRRYRIPFSLIMIDIDHFKNINDSFGHLEGDRVLCDMAECLARNIRRIDMLGRWGGEEFMIICPATDLKGGFGLAEKLRIAIADFQYSTGRSHSASFGVSQVDVADNLSTLLARADRQLYRAKESGRNRVCAECSAA